MTFIVSMFQAGHKDESKMSWVDVERLACSKLLLIGDKLIGLL